MTKRQQTSSHLTTLPMLPAEAIYIGVDIGKFKHVAGFVSKTLLERHQHFENCPAFTFEQSGASVLLWSAFVRMVHWNTASFFWNKLVTTIDLFSTIY